VFIIFALKEVIQGHTFRVNMSLLQYVNFEGQGQRSSVKVQGYRKNLAKVVGATSSEGILVLNKLSSFNQ